MKTNPFHDQVAIITGASAGIGKALALQLAEQGARIAIAARRANRLEELAVQCRKVGAEVLVAPTDVTDESQCKALVEKTVAEFGHLDLLINNAGMAASALFEEFPDLNLFRHTVDINFFGAVNCTFYALPHLLQTKGRLVVMSSLGGVAAIPYNTPYCASKYGLHGFCDSLRMEVAQRGVSVTVICPSWVATEFHAAQIMKDGQPRGEEHGKDMYTSKTMSAERCAQITLRAAHHRRRELIMGPGRWAVLLKALSPGLIDWIALNIFFKSAARRAQKARARADQ